MNIIAVDDEKLALDTLVDSIEKSVAEARVHGFRDPEEARDFVRENSCEIAFLDIKMVRVFITDLNRKRVSVNPLRTPKLVRVFITDLNKHMKSKP